MSSRDWRPWAAACSSSLRRWQLPRAVLAFLISCALHIGCGRSDEDTQRAKVAEHRIYTYASGTVTSRDGTVIGYRRIGQGPGLLIVQGAMGTMYNYNELAIALADDFTVFIADRRGRGASPLPYTPELASIERHVEDVDALRQASGAEFVFGLSSGAIIALESTRMQEGIKRTVLYEPPFYPERDVPRKQIARVHAEIEKNDYPAAMVTVMGIVKLAPWYLSLMPRSLQKRGAASMLHDQAKHDTGPYAPLRDLLPTMRFDFKVLEQRGDSLRSYKGVQTPVLLLGGTKSPGYLKVALDALQQTLPHAQRDVLRGLDHSGPWNKDRGGAPEIVAAHIRAFLSIGTGTQSGSDAERQEVSAAR
ncbi:MAG: hypothetical protein JWN48_3672 [Myxococcaceae bacterium]|nr:hypothetical protein [Myxococcaceae bacterium]